MEILKVTLDGKEVDVEFNERTQLSDSELDRVQGGIPTPWTTEPTLQYHYVCEICGWESNLCNTRGEARNHTTSHIVATSHNGFRCVESSMPED